MSCSDKLFKALKCRLTQLGQSDQTTVIIDNSGDITYNNPNAHYRIFYLKNVDGERLCYTYVLGCRIIFSEEQYTRLKMLSYEIARKNEERLIKYLYGSESN